MLSKRTRYAILALTKLAKERAVGNEFTLIGDIALSERVPKRFLENILLDLKKLGYVSSRLGKCGGYALAQNPEDINLLRILCDFEGTVALTPCISGNSYKPCEFCKDESMCKIRATFCSIRDHTEAVLKSTTIQSLI